MEDTSNNHEATPVAITDNVKLGDLAGRIKGLGLLLGVVGLTGAAVWGGLVGDGYARFFHSYLVNYAYFLCIAIGGLFFTILQPLVNAQWSVVIRRLGEIVTATLPMFIVLSLVFLLPMALGNTKLYIWSNPEVMANDHLLHAKAGWLNPLFFMVRILGYLVILAGIGKYFVSKSTAQDESGDLKFSRSIKRASPPAMIVFALTLSLLAFDLLMTLEPHWFSTIFGVYYFGGSVMCIMAFLIVFGKVLQGAGRLQSAITVEHYHDLGKLLFAFVFFWGYIAFSQFMLIWMANMPEETGWFFWRMELGTKEAPGYGWISLFLVFFHFALPFVILLSRWTKRLSFRLAGKELPVLAIMATYVLVVHWADIYWLVMPSYWPEELVFHPMDLLNLAGVGGFFLFALGSAASKVNLLAIKDPNLRTSMRFENQ